MISREAVNINYVVLGITISEFESTIKRACGVKRQDYHLKTCVIINKTKVLLIYCAKQVHRGVN